MPRTTMSKRPSSCRSSASMIPAPQIARSGGRIAWASDFPKSPGTARIRSPASASVTSAR